MLQEEREIAFSELTEEQRYYIEAKTAKQDERNFFIELGVDRLLNPNERMILYLVYASGYTIAEIARKYNKSRQTVNQLKMRTLNKLRKMEKLGFCNRGVKDGSGLYVIRRTKARAILIEVCFCDNEKDVAIYKRVGSHDAAAHAIYEALCETVIREEGQGEKGKEVFMDFVGSIAARDWHTRRIILPSVVVAQAIKESAWGTSELARKANALFGIKRNGWNGRIYVKDALEQRADGNYDTVEQTQWRAYDGWEESVLDHNTYIAERSTDGGRTLRYAPVIGCADHTLAARYLQECGYATAHGYAESLIHDYIEKYQLTRFDS